MPDRKIWKQKKKIPIHGVQQILKGAINSENFWLDQRAYSCPFRRLDIVQENHEVYHQYFHSSHFKAQCSSVWIYSRCCHPYIRPRHSLWSERSLDFNFSFLPVSIVKTRHVLIELQLLLPISQLSPEAVPEPQHPTYERDNHIFPAQYPHTVGPGAQHMVWLWRWSVSFGSSRDSATDHSKCICLDTVLTLIIAQQDWGSELKWQESQRLQWTIGLFSVHIGGSVLNCYTGLFPDYLWDFLCENLGYYFAKTRLRHFSWRWRGWRRRRQQSVWPASQGGGAWGLTVVSISQ